MDSGVEWIVDSGEREWIVKWIVEWWSSQNESLCMNQNRLATVQPDDVQTVGPSPVKIPDGGVLTGDGPTVHFFHDERNLPYHLIETHETRPITY